MQAIKVENLTKIYRLQDIANSKLKDTFKFLRKKHQKEFYALKDVSFNVQKGDVVGIIGVNGSGKSTLLKILTGVLQPTSGTVTIEGKVSSIIELGTGFNHELTGIENIYLTGSLLGFSKSEIEEKMDEIIKFADIGDFIKQPVKIYSSGMVVRLAFAIAANVESDILIIDEALAVGDVKFAFKCINHMNRLVKKGTTILLVTHDTQTVKSFCKRAIWLHEGQIKMDSDTQSVTSKYIRFLFEHELKMESDQPDIDEQLEISDVYENLDENDASSPKIPDSYEFKSNDWFFAKSKDFEVKTDNGLLLINSHSSEDFHHLFLGSSAPNKLPEISNDFLIYPEQNYALIYNIATNIKIRIGVSVFDSNDKLAEFTHNIFSKDSNRALIFKTPENAKHFNIWIEFFGQGKILIDGVKLIRINEEEKALFSNKFPDFIYEENNISKALNIADLELILRNYHIIKEGKIDFNALQELKSKTKDIIINFENTKWHILTDEKFHWKIQNASLLVNSSLGDGNFQYIWTGGSSWLDNPPDDKSNFVLDPNLTYELIINGKFHLNTRFWVIFFDENNHRTDRIFNIEPETKKAEFSFQSLEKVSFYRMAFEFIGNGSCEIYEIVMRKKQ